MLVERWIGLRFRIAKPGLEGIDRPLDRLQMERGQFRVHVRMDGARHCFRRRSSFRITPCSDEYMRRLERVKGGVHCQSIDFAAVVVGGRHAVLKVFLRAISWRNGSERKLRQAKRRSQRSPLITVGRIVKLLIISTENSYK